MTPAQRDWLLDLPDKVFQQLRINTREHTMPSVLMSAELSAPTLYGAVVVLSMRKAPRGQI